MADTTRRNSPAKQPVTRHPLFPVLVVLWFGALFGLASLAIRPALIERVVLATGIDHVIAMAAPPLGTTTRILIALAMTVLGCLIGLLVARRVARPSSQVASARSRRSDPAANAASPVALFGGARQDDADEDLVVLDEEDEEEDAPVVRRRRQLALLPDEPAAAFDDHAPVPGTTQILSVAELELDSFDQIDDIWVRSPERHEVSADESASDEDDLAFAPAAPNPLNRIDTFAQLAREIGGENTAEDAQPRSNRLFETYVRRVNAGVGSNDADPTPAPGFVSLPSLDEHDLTARSESPAEPKTAPSVDEATYANAAERIASAPLDTLSHVELLERLGMTIARRRAEAALAAERQALADADVHARGDQAEAPPAPAPFTPPAPVSAEIPQAIPAALRPHWLDDADQDDDALPAYVPARHIAMKPSASLAAPDQEDVLAAGYSSLLGVTKPAARQEFVRNDDADAGEPPMPPVFAFPGLQEAAPAAPRTFDPPAAAKTVADEPATDQTEQALRAALATLRRMSGAA